MLKVSLSKSICSLRLNSLEIYSSSNLSLLRFMSESTSFSLWITSSSLIKSWATVRGGANSSLFCIARLLTVSTTSNLTVVEYWPPKNFILTSEVKLPSSIGKPVMTPVLGSKSIPKSSSGYILYLTLTNSSDLTRPSLEIIGSIVGSILTIGSSLSLTKITCLGEYWSGFLYLYPITKVRSKTTPKKIE